MQVAARKRSLHRQHIRENGHDCASIRECAHVVAGARKRLIAASAFAGVSFGIASTQTVSKCDTARPPCMRGTAAAGRANAAPLRPGSAGKAARKAIERSSARLRAALIDAFGLGRLRRTRANVFRMSVSTLLV
jgi:hypothetical protein